MNKHVYFACMIACCMMPEMVDAQQYSIVNFKLHKPIQGLELFVDNDDIWIATDHGAITFDGTDFTLLYNGDNGLTSDTVRRINKDALGNMWFQTDEAVNVKKQSWEYYIRNATVEVHQIIESQTSGVWMIHSVRNQQTGAMVYELLEARADGMHVHSASVRPFYIVETSDGTIYATETSRLYRLENEAWVSEVMVTNAGNILITADGDMYLPRYQGYFVRKHDEQTFTEVTPPLFNRLSPKKIVADEEGRLFFHINDRIIMYNGSTYTSITKANGLPNATLVDIAKGSNGQIWILSYDNVRGQSYLSALQLEGSGPSRVTSVIFHDSDVDGVQDVGETGIPGQVIRLEPQLAYVVSDADGKFDITPSSGTNTITWLPRGFWGEGATPLTYTFSSPEDDGQLFPIGVVAADVSDLAVTLTGTATRPGFNTYYSVEIKNEGNVSNDYVVQFNYDPTLTYLESSPPPTVTNTEIGQLEWTMPQLASLKTHSIDVNFGIPATTPLNTIFASAASISPVASENIIDNNVDSLYQLVSGSFDPNDKLVAQGILEHNYVLAGTPLSYTIRFQNTGTDTAFYVKLIDTLDINLDLESLKILSSSHPMTYGLQGRVLTVKYQNIQLPDSNRNEPASHGYLKYAIRSIDAVADQTDVTNSAAIYFDYNLPVMTNTVSNRYVYTLPGGRVTGTVEDEFNGKILFYPNPASRTIFLNDQYRDKFQYATILSVRGNNVGSYTVKEGKIQLNETAPGLYLLRLIGKDISLVRKIVITH